MEVLSITLKSEGNNAITIQSIWATKKDISQSKYKQSIKITLSNSASLTMAAVCKAVRQCSSWAVGSAPAASSILTNSRPSIEQYQANGLAEELCENMHNVSKYEITWKQSKSDLHGSTKFETNNSRWVQQIHSSPRNHHTLIYSLVFSHRIWKPIHWCKNFLISTEEWSKVFKYSMWQSACLRNLWSLGDNCKKYYCVSVRIII